MRCKLRLRIIANAKSRMNKKKGAPLVRLLYLWKQRISACDAGRPTAGPYEYPKLRICTHAWVLPCLGMFVGARRCLARLAGNMGSIPRRRGCAVKPRAVACIYLWKQRVSASISVVYTDALWASSISITLLAETLSVLWLGLTLLFWYYQLKLISVCWAGRPPRTTTIVAMNCIPDISVRARRKQPLQTFFV